MDAATPRHAEADAPLESVERSPRTHVDSQPLPTDSMVTVPLSESDSSPACDDGVSPTAPSPKIVVEKRMSSRPNSAEIMAAFGHRRSSEEQLSPTVSLPEEPVPESPLTPTARSRSSSDSNQSAHVNWAELDKKEEQEPEGEGQDDVCVAVRIRGVANRNRPWRCCSPV